MTHITKGVSLSNETASKVQNNININMKTETPNSIETQNPYNNLTVEPPQQVSYASIIANESQEESLNELHFLRKVLDIYMAQNLIYKNKKIICSAEDLIVLLRIITNNCIVDLETSFLDDNCCGCIDTSKIPLYDVDKIWITVGQERYIFKYKFPEAVALFEKYNISLKYCLNDNPIKYNQTND